MSRLGLLGKVIKAVQHGITIQVRLLFDLAMTDCFDQLPEWAKKKLSISSKHQEWKRCASCHIYSTSAKLKACSGCSHRSQPVFYCSKECQKAHWPRHRADCRMKDPAFSGINIPERDSETQRLEKRTERWRFAHYQILLFCILNIYHFNPELDPSRHFILFELDQKTMQIVLTSVQSMGRHAHYFHNPSVQALIKPGCIFYMMTVQTSIPSTVEVRNSSLNQEILPEVISLESRSKIKGYSQWPWIAAHLTRKWQPSAEIAWKAQHLFLDAIDLNTKKGVSFDDFVCPNLPLEQGIRMTPARMAPWDEKLASIDFWNPLMVTGRLARVLGAEYTDDNAVPPNVPETSDSLIVVNTQ